MWSRPAMIGVLTAEALDQRYGPVHVGLLYLPEVGGAVITAFAFGAVLRKRSLHFLPLAGMLFLAAGIAVFRIKVPSSEAATLVGAGLTGVGLGATVAPALFIASFALAAPGLQRVYAIIELLRGVAAFMIAPVFVHFAATAGGNLDASGSRCGSAWGSRWGVPSPRSCSMCSAARARTCLTSTASSQARTRHSTRHLCWRESAGPRPIERPAPHVQ